LWFGRDDARARFPQGRTIHVTEVIPDRVGLVPNQVGHCGESSLVLGALGASLGMPVYPADEYDPSDSGFLSTALGENDHVAPPADALLAGMEPIVASYEDRFTGSWAADRAGATPLVLTAPPTTLTARTKSPSRANHHLKGNSQST
jgi:hypothetical protein